MLELHFAAQQKQSSTLAKLVIEQMDVVRQAVFVQPLVELLFIDACDPIAITLAIDTYHSDCDAMGSAIGVLASYNYTDYLRQRKVGVGTFQTLKSWSINYMNSDERHQIPSTQMKNPNEICRHSVARCSIKKY